MSQPFFRRWIAGFLRGVTGSSEKDAEESPPTPAGGGEPRAAGPRDAPAEERVAGGRVLSDRYDVIRELGRGGMGTVYLARDPLLDRNVAIKVLRQGAFDPNALERFRREARVAARMDHPAIVTVHDIGDDHGIVYLVMPYVPGKSLRERISKGPLSTSESIEIGFQAAEALEYAHEQGVVHRDVKPENILIGDQADSIRVRITDFGLASVRSLKRLTQSGLVVGTPQYLSPEQLTDRPVDGRADLFALGVVLYECLTGQPPFSGPFEAVSYQILHAPAPKPSELGVNLEAGLESLLLRCLEKAAEDRPQSGRELAVELRRLGAANPAERLTTSTVSQPAPPRRALPAPARLAGRERELAELGRALVSAERGECHLAVVAGESGTGKTRLLDELEAVASRKGFRVLRGRFVEMGRRFPYQGFCEALQEYLRLPDEERPARLDDLASELTALFPVLGESLRSTGAGSGAHTAPFEDRTRIFELLSRAFARIAAAEPLLLLLEDLHGADVSIDALEYLCRRLTATRTLLVATYRNEEVSRGHPLLRLLEGLEGDRRFHALRIGPLSPAEHRAMVEGLLGSAVLSPAIAETLHEATEGNAYFTREFVRALLEAGALQRDETGCWSLREGSLPSGGGELPSTIQQAVERRLARLTPALRELLGRASVLGRSFDLSELAVLWPDGGLESAVDELAANGFLEEERLARGDRFVFPSAVLREVLHASLPRARRRSLHRTVAEELESRYRGRLERVEPRLLEHYVQAEVGARVIEIGRSLARRSLATFSPEAAEHAARAVLDFLEVDGEVPPPEGDSGVERGERIEAEVRLALGTALRMGRGGREAGLAELERAIACGGRAGATDLVLEASVAAAQTAWEARRIDSVRRLVDSSLPLARASGDRPALRALLTLGATVSNLAGEYERAREYAQEAEAVTQPQRRAGNELPSGGVLRVALTASVEASHPADVRVDDELEVLANAFETLVRSDAHGNPLPNLAESWELLEDGRTFRFRLRPDVSFQDGVRLTAADVKASIEEGLRRASESLPAAYRAIEGVDAYVSGGRRSPGPLAAAFGECRPSGSADPDAAAATEEPTPRPPGGAGGGAPPPSAAVAARGPHVLEITLSGRLPLYPAMLADGTTAVARVQAGVCVGTGPFLPPRREGKVLHLARRQSHWRRVPRLDAIEVRTCVPAGEIASGLRRGELDLARDLPPSELEALLEDRGLRAGLVEGTRPNIYLVVFNVLSSRALAVPGVRAALRGVVRVRDLVRANLGRFAEPAESLLPPGVLGHDPNRRRPLLPLEDARALLERAGVPRPLRLRAAVHPIFQDRHSAFLEGLLADWARLDVQVEAVTPGMEAFLAAERDASGIDLLLGRYISEYQDPDNFCHKLFHSADGVFKRLVSSGELDALIESGRAETWQGERDRLYRRVEDTLASSDAILPLFHEVEYRLAGPRVRGLELTPAPPYVNYAELGVIAVGESARARRAGVLQVPLSTSVESLDPARIFFVQQAEVCQAVFEMLTREGARASIVPSLSWDIRPLDGGRAHSIRLRDDVRFHDGRKLTARDVAFSFERLLLDPESDSRWLLAPIRGARAMLEGRTGSLDGVSLLASHELRVELEEPVAFFSALLSYYATAILPEGTGALGRSWREGCVGTGPFRVARFEPGAHLELEANPHYWRGGMPRCEGVRFTFQVPPEEIRDGFRAGRWGLAWDLPPADVEALRRDTSLAATYREMPSLSTYFLMFNSRKGPLADERTRHRLARALSPEAIVARTVGRMAVAAEGLIPPDLLGRAPRRRSFAAEASGGGPRLALRAMRHPIFDGAYAAVASEVASTLSRSGFELSIVPERVGGHGWTDVDVDVVLSRWIADYPDADSFLYGLTHSTGGVCGHLCGNADLDRVIERARRESDLEERRSLYRDAEALIAERSLLVPLFHEQASRFARPEVADFELTLSGPHVVYEKLSLRA